MSRRTFTIDIDVLARMKSRKEYRNTSTEELIRLIRIGMKIIEEDERMLDEHGILRSHYHLPPHQKNAIAAAAFYNLLKTTE